MLMTVGISGRFWEEAVMTVVYLLNRSAIRSLDIKMAHEVWDNKKPAVHHLQAFGRVTYMKITCPHHTKLDLRQLKVVFIVYELGSKVYRLYDPSGASSRIP